MYRETSCLRLVFHKTEETSKKAESTARVREACEVPVAFDRVNRRGEQGPHRVQTRNDSQTGSKLGPNREALSLLFSVSDARKLLIFFAWGARGPEFKSRRPDQLFQPLISWIRFAL